MSCPKAASDALSGLTAARLTCVAARHEGHSRVHVSLSVLHSGGIWMRLQRTPDSCSASVALSACLPALQTRL